MTDTFAEDVTFSLQREVKTTFNPGAWGGPAQIFVLAQVVHRTIVILDSHLNGASCEITTCTRDYPGFHYLYRCLKPVDNQLLIIQFATMESKASFDKKQANHKGKGKKEQLNPIHFTAFLKAPETIFDPRLLLRISNVLPPDPNRRRRGRHWVFVFGCLLALSSLSLCYHLLFNQLWRHAYECPLHSLKRIRLDILPD